MQVKLAAIFGVVFCLSMLLALGDSKKPIKDLDEICKQSMSVLSDLTTHVKALYTNLKGKKQDIKMPLMKDGIRTSVNFMKKFKKITKIGNPSQFPKRNILEDLRYECDDAITTVKGVSKVLKQLKLCCNKTEETLTSMETFESVRNASGKIKNRILRCGYGKRDHVLVEGNVVNIDKKKILSVLNRSKRAAPEDNEEINDDDIIGDLADPPKVHETDQSSHEINSVKAVNMMELYKNGGVAKRADLFEVSIEHKCVCREKTCECCLLINHPASSDTPYSGCMGIQQLTECKKSGIKLFLKFMGLEASFVIMDGNSVCFNFQTIPVSICFEPYGFQFCPRRKTFRTCLMIQLEIFGFRIASFNLHCLVIALDGEKDLLRLRQADDSWIPQRGALTVLYDWIADIVISQMELEKKKVARHL